MPRRHRSTSPSRRRRSRELVVEGLEQRRLLAANVAVASDAGPASSPLVRLVDAESGAERASVMAFESTFRGGVRLAMGRITGNAAPDIVAGSGSGRVAEVRVFKTVTSGATTTLQQVLAFQPFGPSYRGGIDLAVGDVDGDTREDFIVSKSREGGDVRVFRTLAPTTPSGNPTVDVANPYVTIAKPFGAAYTGGSSVGVADVGEFSNGGLVKNVGDNKVEILVGSGVGIPARVLVYDVSRPSAPRVADTIRPSLPSWFQGGVSVSGGRYAASGVADSIDDIFVSAGRGGASQTFVYDGTVGAAANTLLRYFAPFATLARPNAAAFTAPVDVDGNGQIDRFLVTQGDPGGPAGISNVSIAGVRSAAAVTTLTGPLRIAAARTVFANQTVNGIVADPTPTSGIPAGTSRPMQIRDIVTGGGVTAVAGQAVAFKYTGRLADGTVFESSQTTVTLGQNMPVKGWDAGLTGMKVGGRRLLNTPPELAFGNAGRAGVPSNSSVFYDVEVVSATSPATIGGASTGALTAGVGIMTASGTLTVNDPDAGEAVFAAPAASALNGTYGAFTFNATTGAWSYALDTLRPATLLLRSSQTVTESLPVTSLDGTASRTIQVSVTGFTLQTTTAATRVVSGSIPVGTVRNMQYADIVPGTGTVTATTGKTLTVKYLGMKADGTVFNSWRPLGTFVLGVQPLIAGFDAALTGMKAGGVRLAVIPPELAYGDAGASDGSLKNETLIFRIEVESIT